MYKRRFFPTLASLTLLLSCNPTPPASITPSATPKPSISPAPQATTAPVKPAGIAFDLTQGRGVIGGQLLNATTQALIKQPVRLTVSGPDQDKVEQTRFETSDGHFSVVLKKGVEPAINKPIQITVVANAEGYFATSTSLNLTDSKHDSFVMKMVSMNAAPEGIAVASTNADAAGGKLNQPLTLSATEQNSKTLASFALKPETVLRDANGQPLSGQLQTHVGYFSNTTARSLEAFPGGFTPIVTQNGQDGNGYFVTGGFVSVEITDENGRKASQFSQPADITIQIPKDTINPETGKQVAPGDTIGIWSYDPNTGKWVGEGQGKVSGPDANGNFNVTYQASHLSYWNIDWHNSAVCHPKVMLNWDSDNHIGVQVSLLFEGQDWYTPTNILADPENQLYNVPINKKLTFVAKYNNKQVGQTEVTLNESCADVNLAISTAGLPVARKLPVFVTLSGQTAFTRDELSALADRFGLNDELKTKVLNYTHPGDANAPFTFSESHLKALEALGATGIRQLKSLIETKLRPTVYLYYKTSDPNDWQWQWSYFNQGQGELSLLDNQSYYFSGSIYYNGRYYYLSKTVEITPDMQSLTLDLQDAELTLDAVRNYLSGLSGVAIPGLN